MPDDEFTRSMWEAFVRSAPPGEGGTPPERIVAELTDADMVAEGMEIIIGGMATSYTDAALGEGMDTVIVNFFGQRAASHTKSATRIVFSMDGFSMVVRNIVRFAQDQDIDLF